MKRIKSAVVFVTTAAVLAGHGLGFARDASPIDAARQLNEAFIQVADQASSSVVVITVTGKSTETESEEMGSFLDALPPELKRYWEEHNKRKRAKPHLVYGEGSGIVVTADGYILTNNHVVENADKIVVRFKDGRQFDGTIQGRDPESDVAVIKIRATGLTPAKLGDSDATRVGEFVLAVGAPFTLSYSVTFGHVSAKGRSFQGEMGPSYSDQDFIQTDASINPGNSGGPLVNLYGEVVAINTMIQGMNTGIGFAIPINLAKRVMAHLIDEGRYNRSWLGIVIGDLRDDPAFQALDDKVAPDAQEGVVVQAITTGGPAAKSELRAGDVITAVDDKPVKTSRQLKDEIAAEAPGHVTVLNVVRAREHIVVKVTVAALPRDQDMTAETHSPSREGKAVPLGLTIEPIGKRAPGEHGVVVTAVEQDSPAAESGIFPGDVITEVNREPISNPRQFRDAIKSANVKRGIMISLISNDASSFVVLKDDSK